MPKMYYFNGVELPALPEYDKTEYPYAWITEYRNPQTDKTIYYIFNVASEVYPHKFEISSYGGWLSAYTPDGIKGDKLQYDPAKHDDWYTTGEFLKFPDGFNGMLVAEGGHIEPLDEWLKEYIPIWSNFDILDTDGSVYFTKCDDPVPVEDEDDGVQLYSWLIGFLIGLIQKPALTFDAPPAQDPVAYLYNGVRLPDISKVLSDKNSYACIVYDPSNGRYHLYFGEVMGVRYPEYDAPGTAIWDYIIFGDFAGDAYATQYRLFPGASEWTLFTETASGIILSDSTSDRNMVWANYDILNEDGSVYMAASDPIPVYE